MAGGCCEWSERDITPSSLLPTFLPLILMFLLNNLLNSIFTLFLQQRWFRCISHLRANWIREPIRERSTKGLRSIWWGMRSRRRRRHLKIILFWRRYRFLFYAVMFILWWDGGTLSCIPRMLRTLARIDCWSLLFLINYNYPSSLLRVTSSLVCSWSPRRCFYSKKLI